MMFFFIFYCVIIIIKKKKLESCSRMVPSKVCQLSHVFFSGLLVHCALMNYSYIWLRT
jgi:hypothetical protein